MFVRSPSPFDISPYYTSWSQCCFLSSCHLSVHKTLWFHWLTSIWHVLVTRPQRLNCFTLVLPSSSSPFIRYSLRVRAAQSRPKAWVGRLLDEWYIKGFPFLVLRTLQHKIHTTSPDSKSFNYWENLAEGELVLPGRCRLWQSAKMLIII